MLLYRKTYDDNQEWVAERRKVDWICVGIYSRFWNLAQKDQNEDDLLEYFKECWVILMFLLIFVSWCTKKFVCLINTNTNTDTHV